MYDVLNQQIHPLMEQPSCRLKVRTVAQRLERAWRLTLPFRILYYHTLALALDATETLNPNPYLYVLPTPTPAPTLRSNPNPNPSPDPMLTLTLTLTRCTGAASGARVEI